MVVVVSGVVGGKRGKAATPSASINKMLGKYTGAELKPFAGRPGAMDAFKLPSLIGDQRIFRGDVKK